MCSTAIIAERRANAARRDVGIEVRSTFWSLWQAAVMIGAPLLTIAVPGALAYFAYQTLGCTLSQL